MYRAQHVKCGKGAHQHITPKILVVNAKLQTQQHLETIPN